MSSCSHTRKNGMNAATGGMKRSDSTKKRRSYLPRKRKRAKMYAAGTARMQPSSNEARTMIRLFCRPVMMVTMFSTSSKLASVGVKKNFGGYEMISTLVLNADMTIQMIGATATSTMTASSR